MKKYKCEVALISEYEIEINDEDLGTEFLENFNKHFFDCEDWSDHAMYIAERKACGDIFIEGYGIPLINGENPNYDNDERSLEKAINIKVIFENMPNVDLEEL